MFFVTEGIAKVRVYYGSPGPERLYTVDENMFVVILSNIFAAGLGVGFKKPIGFDPAKMISVADDLTPLAIIVDVFCVAGWDGFELFGLLAVTCAILLLTLIVGTYFVDR